MWRVLVHTLLDGLIAVFMFTPVITLLATGAGLLVTFPLALPVWWVLFMTARLFGRIERSRYAVLLDVDLPDPVPPLPEGSWWARLKTRARTGSRWREIAYFPAHFPLGVFNMAVMLAVWCGSAALVALPTYVAALPGDTAKFGLFEIGPGLSAFAATLVGLAGLVVIAPWVTLGLARLDSGLARSLLGPPRRDQIAAQVTALESRRQAAVDTAEAERRRIERDLHDGAQQRLVALAVDLGTAREKFADDPESAQQLLDHAHDEAKAALKEIRDLVRGIHPVILEDRGLDAALSAVVARSPVPVRLSVDLTRRPPPETESTAYFVVSEALANVARHAGASAASISIIRTGDRLVVEVADDGVGGADAARGTGLRGLRDRVQAIGGTLHLISPDGGPTTLLVELPCGS